MRAYTIYNEPPHQLFERGSPHPIFLENFNRNFLVLSTFFLPRSTLLCCLVFRTNILKYICNNLFCFDKFLRGLLSTYLLWKSLVKYNSVYVWLYGNGLYLCVIKF